MTLPCSRRARRSYNELTGRPTYGVIPYTDGLWLDTEDSVSVLAHRVVGDPQPPRGADWLRVAAIRLPRISNSTDVEALACEPGVLVRWVTDPADLADADVVVIPGSKATVSDLAWLRERGLADGITAHAATGKPVLGICGGFQMLCKRIDDPVESKAGIVEGLGLLDADIAFAPDKTLRHWDSPLHGYEIHHGQLERPHRGRLARCRDPPRPRLRHTLAWVARQRRLSPPVADRSRKAAADPGLSSPTMSTCLRGVTPSST